MKKQPFANFCLTGVSITEFGLKIPSPFSSLEITNSEITSMTAWTLNCVVGGDTSRKINAAAFEALLYSAAQSANSYKNSSGIPVSFVFGWLDEYGNVAEYISYQGFTLKFNVSTNGLYMNYKLTGYASLSVQSSMPVLHIPAISGFVQPSAVAEALAKSVKATSYYQLDIDHNDAPTLVSHGALTTSFNKYVRGEFSAEDDYENFPGLLPLSKSYSSSRDAAGLKSGYKSLGQVLNNASVTPIVDFLKKSNTDTTPQCAAFSYWVDEPTMTQPGTIHYKSNASLQSSESLKVLEYGTSNTNILTLQGSYDGVAYNMSNMNFTQVGFTVDGSGNTIAQGAEIVNSWSSSLADTFQTANIINDINALATQFSGDFTITIPGTVKTYNLAQPVSLLVMTGGTLSPITGIYNVITVSHNISNTFITTLKVQRLVMSSANQVASSQGILIAGSGNYADSSYITSKNIITPYKVEFGELYPTFEHMAVDL
ncbi:MAG: hypothetical protein NC548_50415 [Lachnospiraceae bacterium]|nr:hypothetical protein [Lachnospiraceae bacterium]MCM1232033.1 hypothetical protein [Ruminococcus flavefaciens]